MGSSESMQRSYYWSFRLFLTLYLTGAWIRRADRLFLGGFFLLQNRDDTWLKVPGILAETTNEQTRVSLSSSIPPLSFLPLETWTEERTLGYGTMGANISAERTARTYVFLSRATDIPFLPFFSRSLFSGFSSSLCRCKCLSLPYHICTLLWRFIYNIKPDLNNYSNFAGQALELQSDKVRQTFPVFGDPVRRLTSSYFSRRSRVYFLLHLSIRSDNGAFDLEQSLCAKT